MRMPFGLRIIRINYSYYSQAEPFALFVIIGLILLIIGVVFLLQNLGYISAGAWSIIWPAILIVAGLSLILKGKMGDHGFWWEEHFGWKKNEIKKEE